AVQLAHGDRCLPPVRAARYFSQGVPELAGAGGESPRQVSRALPLTAFRRARSMPDNEDSSKKRTHSLTDHQYGTDAGHSHDGDDADHDHDHDDFGADGAPGD